LALHVKKTNNAQNHQFGQIEAITVHLTILNDHINQNLIKFCLFPIMKK